VVGGYLIAFAVLLITGARLGQTHGYRRIFLLGVGLFTTASLLCGLAPNVIALVLARVAQGLGAALMFPQTLTGIQLNFAGGQRARAIGLYAMALSACAVAGQILGGALISADLAGSQWRAIFLINVPVGFLVIAAGWRYLPHDAQRTPRRLDLRGVAALSAALLLLVVPLVLGHGQGWPAWTWLCLGVGAVMAAGCLLLSAAYAAISAALFTGHYGEPLLAVLLGAGGLGLGIQFNALVAHLTTIVPADYAPDISGVTTVTLQIGGAIGVAALGTLYLSLNDHAGAGHATHAFALTTAAFTAIALLASASARRVARSRLTAEAPMLLHR
jgi:hypothetical protein